VMLQITAGGRRRAVEVSGGGGRFTVSIDGRELTADVHQLNGAWSLLIGPGDAGTCARSYEVAFAGGQDGAMMVHVDGQPVPVSVAPLRPTWRARDRGAVEAGRGDAGPQRITAPMPGKIVKVLVKPGDRVEPRQGLIVVEAMKMENELRARAAGTIAEVRVTEGASVEAGAILIVVE
jgi:biotin carboxyl carrier protein